MSKFINLDELVEKNKKTFKFQGKEYTIKGLTVGDFAAITSKRQILESDKNVGIDEMYNLMVDVVSRAVPEMTKESLQNLTVEQLSALTKFVQEQDSASQEVQEEMGN